MGLSAHAKLCGPSAAGAQLGLAQHMQRTLTPVSRWRLSLNRAAASTRDPVGASQWRRSLGSLQHHVVSCRVSPAELACAFNFKFHPPPARQVHLVKMPGSKHRPTPKC